MARWGFMFVVVYLIAVAHHAAARVVPGDNAAAGLADQKNFASFGGVSGYTGVGDDGIPYGGVGGGVGAGGGLAGINGFGGFRAFIGTLPTGGLGVALGNIGGGGLGGALGNIGGGDGGGIGGGLPYP